MNDDKQHEQELAKLGCAVREARERSGLSEREVADAVPGISLAGVRAIEAGKRNLDYERLIRLAHVLDTGPTALILRAESLSADR